MAAQLITETDVLDASAPPMLIYGQPGSWKTSIAQTASKPLTLDFDRGAHRTAYRKSVMRFDQWRDVIEQHKAFAPYDTIVIDTIGHCLDLLSIAIVDESGKHGNRNGGLSMQGWGVLKNRFGAWIRTFRAEGKQIVMLAHEKEDKDGDNRIMRPAIVGGSYGTVMELADLVGYLSIRGNQRVLDFNASDSYHAKNSAGLPPITVPDLSTKPTFLADILTEARNRIGRTAQASAAVAYAVSEWKTWLGKVETLDQLNTRLPELSKVKPASAKAQVWTLIQAFAEENAWSFDKEAKVFVDGGANEGEAA